MHLHVFIESVFITGSFHPAVCPSPHQPLQELEGFPTGSALSGPEVRDSLTQQHMCASFTTRWYQK